MCRFQALDNDQTCTRHGTPAQIQYRTRDVVEPPQHILDYHDTDSFGMDLHIDTVRNLVRHKNVPHRTDSTMCDTLRDTVDNWPYLARLYQSRYRQCLERNSNNRVLISDFI